MDKVTVIIPTYNRFKYLLNAIDSVQKQTHTNIEIIVVNDCSTQKEYYDYNFDENVTIIHLKENSKTKFGFVCPQRNFGIQKATGKYIAFLDDDDVWFPNKLELQIKAMKENNCKMSCTEGLYGNGIYNKDKYYKKMLAEQHFDCFKDVYINTHLFNNNNFDYPDVWNLDFLKIGNCCICSSVIIDKDVIDKTGEFSIVNIGLEDYEYWLRALKYTDCVYLTDVCFYYDEGHGEGQNY